MKKIKVDNIINIVNDVLLVVISLVMLYPIFYIFVSSISDPVKFQQATARQEFILVPKGFTFKYMAEHFQNGDIWRAYGNTIFYTVVGTILALFFSITCAYVLSRKGLKVIKILNLIVVLTMWLKPGMIAQYEQIRDYGMKGNVIGILLPFAFTAYNVILLRTYFGSIPQDIDESAQIDGASHFRILTSIYIPASVPGITTVGLFYAIDRWNGYFWAETLLGQKTELLPLQVLVKSVLNSGGGDSGNPFQGMVSAYALIVIAIVPVMLIFPFIQKYFKKGVMVGAVK